MVSYDVDDARQEGESPRQSSPAWSGDAFFPGEGLPVEGALESGRREARGRKGEAWRKRH